MKKCYLIGAASMMLLTAAFVCSPDSGMHAKAESQATLHAGEQKKQSPKEDIVLSGNVIASFDDKGQMIYHPQGDARHDSYAIKTLISNDEKKTLILPKGKTIYIDEMIDVGSNTTIIANGTKIVQTIDKKGIFENEIDGASYDAVKNVTIVGGTWLNSGNTQAHTMFRFAHGKNLRFEKVSIDTNYQSHAIELIACKDVVVDGCKLLAKNDKTKNKTSVEEILQLDIATKTTAPGVYRDGGQKKKYVNGQTCQNITVKNSVLRGSRGLCANFSPKEPAYLNKMHRNVTVTNCTITGTSAEGIALFNTAGFHVKNNKVTTNSTRTSTPYATAIHAVLIGKLPLAVKYSNEIVSNKAYGKYCAILTSSQKGSKYGTTTVKKNQGYALSASNAFKILCCKKVTMSANGKHKR